MRSIARPKYLVAAFADLQGTDDSKRPYETIEPLSAFLTIPIDKSSTKDEIKKLVAKVTAIDDVVLVSWEHRKIPLIGRILVAGSQAIPDWPDERFDMVWVFDRVYASWQFCQVRHLLLHGDRPDGLASLIARAMATRNMLLAGRDDSIDAMALRLGVRRDYLAVLVRLSYLSPELFCADPGRRTAHRADAKATCRAFQKSAARLAGAGAASRICACLDAAPLPLQRSTSDGPKKGPRRHLAPSRASGRGFASLEYDHCDGRPVSGGYVGRI